MIILLSARVVLSAGSTDALSVGASDEAQWAEFKETHGKSYGSAALEAKRFTAFTDNLRMYEERTRYSAHATYGVDQWSDLTLDEFVARNGGCYHPKPIESRVYTDAELRAVRLELDNENDS